VFLSNLLYGLKASLLTILFTLTVLTSLAVSTVALANPDELLLNGGFEEGTTNWANYGGTLSTTTAPIYHGAYAAVFESDTI
jgi:hypothetical protein